MFRHAVLAIALFSLPAVARAAPQLASTPSKERGKPASNIAGKKAKKLSRYAAVEFYEVNTKETLALRFQDDRGRPIKGWQKRFDRFMRCHQTGAVHKMNPRLAHLLYQTARHYEGHRFEVVSGYRHPRVARNPKSPHKKGLACDFRIVGTANAALRDYLRKAYDHVGVGYYPNSTFVHLDVRTGASAFWIDYSGPGQAAAYSTNAREDLRLGRADQTASAEGGPSESGRAEGQDDMDQAGVGAAAQKPVPRPRTAKEIKRPRTELDSLPDPFDN